MQVETRSLKDELQWVSRAVEKRNTIPILSNVLFEAERHTLRLTATDLELSLITELPADEPKPWKITAPARRLLDYLRKVVEPEVNLVPVEDSLWLGVSHGPSASARIAGMSPEAFPEFPKIETVGQLGGISIAVPRVMTTISTEENRFTLSGALLEGGSTTTARMVSTDGHRMGIFPVAYKGPEMRVLVRMSGLNELAHFGTDMVGIGWDDNHLLFTHGHRQILSRELTGNFPDWERCVPKDFPRAVLVEADALRELIDRVSVFADERSHAVRVVVGAGKVAVHSSLSETGEASGSVAIAGGEPGQGEVEIGLNANYLLEFLTLAKGETVAFCYRAPAETTEFMTTDGWQYVVMPMRI